MFGTTRNVVLLNKGLYAAEALALFSRFTTPATDARKILISNLITGLKVAGAWAKYDAFYMCAAETNQAAQRNWVTNAFNLTEVNSPVFGADRGYTPNGTTSYCDTGFDPTTAPSPKFTRNDAYMGAWHRTDLANGAATSFDMANTGTRITNSAASASVISANCVGVTVTEDYAKDKAWSRTASNVWRYYNSGVLSGADPRVDASSALAAFTFNIGRITAINFGLNQCSVFRFGSSLTPAEQLAEFTAIQTYMTAVGAG